MSASNEARLLPKGSVSAWSIIYARPGIGHLLAKSRQPAAGPYLLFNTANRKQFSFRSDTPRR